MARSARRSVRATAALGLAAALLAPGVSHAHAAPAGVRATHPAVAALPGRRSARPQSRPSYDGRFMFARVRYGAGGGPRSRFGYGFGSDAWSHDYPNADEHMSALLKEISTVDARTDATVLLDLEDRAIFRYPLLYMSEPGFWRVSDQGAKNLREHLLKGGFIIFDDFDGPGHWESWQAQIARVLPAYRPIEIDATHPVFRTFFRLDDVYIPHPFSRVRPTYLGIFEDNDPGKRMLALVNWNADLAEYWEWSTSGYLPIDPTNDAFRVGVNYFIYGLTH